MLFPDITVPNILSSRNGNIQFMASGALLLLCTARVRLRSLYPRGDTEKFQNDSSTYPAALY